MTEAEELNYITQVINNRDQIKIAEKIQNELEYKRINDVLIKQAAKKVSVTTVPANMGAGDQVSQVKSVSKPGI